MLLKLKFGKNFSDLFGVHQSFLPCGTERLIFENHSWLIFEISFDIQHYFHLHTIGKCTDTEDRLCLVQSKYGQFQHPKLVAPFS